MKKIFATIAATAAILTACGPAQTIDITGDWVILEVEGEMIELCDLPTVSFTENTYSAFTCVNIVNGEYSRKGDVIVLGEGAMTKMAGDEEAMALEDRIVELASQPLTITASEDEYIYLCDAEGNAVFQLWPATLDEWEESEVCEDSEE